MGAQASKRHSRRTQQEQTSRAAAVSRVSDMKRASSNGNHESTLRVNGPTVQNHSSIAEPTIDQSPPSKRSNSLSNSSSFDKEYPAQLEKMALHSNGISLPGVTEKIAILDFGAQYGKVIDRRVREAKVFSEMFPLSTTARDIIAKGGFKGIIISGGPASVYAPGSPQIDPEIFTCGLPVLGVCYGFQLLNKAFGGSVSRDKIRADGQVKVQLDTKCAMFAGLSDEESVLLTHGDSVRLENVPEGFSVVAKSDDHVAGIACAAKQLFGVQFHPEVDLTENGKKMFDNFLFGVAGCTKSFTMASREDSCIEEIRSIVGNDKVLVMVSGGVDSTVCAALLHKALGADRVTAVHIDNGFMRYNESVHVVKSLNDLHLKVHHYRSTFDFLMGTVNGKEDDFPLEAVTDPELKRQIIGNTFIRVKDKVMSELNLKKEEYFLAQGTLRPDLIESASSLASGHADTIKTHHNDTELVRALRAEGRVIEPLKDFHKDEVRELGMSLGLPTAIVQRHPFPGPGLAIRIICAQKPFVCTDYERTQRILTMMMTPTRPCLEQIDEEARLQFLKHMERQPAFNAWREKFEIKATLLPIRTVGVQGDCRSYSYVAALSTNQRPVPWALLAEYAHAIPTMLHSINRIAYVFGPMVNVPVDGITRTLLNLDTVEEMQKADAAATSGLGGRDSDGRRLAKVEDCTQKIQQMPVVMIPVHFDRASTDKNSYKRSFVLRPFITADFMTGRAAIPTINIPEKNVNLMVDNILRRTTQCSRVLIDLTGKPPGTTEWE